MDRPLAKLTPTPTLTLTLTLTLALTVDRPLAGLLGGQVVHEPIHRGTRRQATDVAYVARTACYLATTPPPPQHVTWLPPLSPEHVARLRSLKLDLELDLPAAAGLGGCRAGLASSRGACLLSRTELHHDYNRLIASRPIAKRRMSGACYLVITPRYPGPSPSGV